MRSKVISEVKVTNNYNLFSFMKGNRAVNLGHVNRLKKSMERYPHLFEIRPILVNKNYQIIDGQHRYVAAIELRVPVFYVIGDDLNVNDAHLVNVNQKNWVPVDFARFFASQGNKHYQQYMELYESYPTLAHSTLYRLLKLGRSPVTNNGNLTVGGSGGTAAINFREGLFEVDNLENAYDWAERLMELRDVYPSSFSSSLTSALLKMFQNPAYNQEQMVQKVQRFGSMLLDKTRGNSVDYLRDLEETYNYRQAENTRVRFF